jgi:chitin disaccharide deacetylase
MAAQRLLIVNADDFGLSAAVNAGIVEAHERGIVTSTSMMVRRPAAAEAAGLAGSRPSLAVGLHVDIGQWDYVSGEWRLAYQHCPPDDAEAAERECRAQLQAFEELMERPPTHLDSHQHTHMSEPLASVTAGLAAELDVPLRARTIPYEGGFYGQAGKGEPYPEGITVERLLDLIESLPPGWTELGCHPGLGVGPAESSYASERELELRTLCDPRVGAAIEGEGVELRSFADLHEI